MARNENWCKRKEILFLRHLYNFLRRAVFKKFHAIFAIPNCSSRHAKNIPDFLVLLGWSHAATLCVPHSRLQLPTSCSQTAVSTPLCFRTYLKAPEWHSAYQNAGKSPLPSAALFQRTPFPTNARRVAFQKKGSF